MEMEIERNEPRESGYLVKVHCVVCQTYVGTDGNLMHPINRTTITLCSSARCASYTFMIIYDPHEISPDSVRAYENILNIKFDVDI